MNSNLQKSIWDHFQNEAAESFSENKPRLDSILRISKKLITTSPSQTQILNIGAGNGYLELSAFNQGFQTYSLDLSEQTVEELKSKGINSYVGSITQMPFSNQQFDIVVASEVLEHLTPDELPKALLEIQRVLKPKGAFIGTVPLEENLNDNLAFCPNCKVKFHRWGHQQSFSIHKLRTILSSHFKIKNIYSTCFVDFKTKNLKKLFKKIIRFLMGRFGIAIAQPNIIFVCKL